jgi:alcohol dehydrogenase class IV
MKNYTVRLPQTIIFGENSYKHIFSSLPTKNEKCLLVTGKHFTQTALFDEIMSTLKKEQPLVVHILSTGHEAPLSNVDSIIDVGRKHHITTVIAIGGGSVIDSAKTAAGIIPLTGDVMPYFTGEKQVTGNGLFFIAVPTTAGTGAEMTKNGVHIDKKTLVKKSIRGESMLPDVAIVDPVLTLSAPPSLTAASGLDAYTQAIESYLSVKANHVSKSLAKQAIILLHHNLKQAYLEPDNLAAKTAVAEGSMLSGMAFAQSGLGAVHGIAHPLGSQLKTAHGLTCAILLPIVLKWNATAVKNEIAELAHGIGVKADQFIDEVKKIQCSLDIPDKFEHLTDDVITFAVENCRSNSMSCNPKEFSDDEVKQLLNECR